MPFVLAAGGCDCGCGSDGSKIGERLWTWGGWECSSALIADASTALEAAGFTAPLCKKTNIAGKRQTDSNSCLVIY